MKFSRYLPKPAVRSTTTAAHAREALKLPVTPLPIKRPGRNSALRLWHGRPFDRQCGPRVPATSATGRSAAEATRAVDRDRQVRQCNREGRIVRGRAENRPDIAVAAAAGECQAVAFSDARRMREANAR